MTCEIRHKESSREYCEFVCATCGKELRLDPNETYDEVYFRCAVSGERVKFQDALTQTPTVQHNNLKTSDIEK